MNKLKKAFALLISVLLLSTCFIGCGGLGGNGGSGEQVNNPTGAYEVKTGDEASGVDFIINYPAGKDITILQLADIQVLCYHTARNETRKNQLKNACFNRLSEHHQIRAWQYVDEAVARVKPDLIVLTGDQVYGETDDSGVLWQEMCERMDTYGVPWLNIFGNHDNESAKGVQWQVDELLKSKHCVFKQGEVTGNSNYNVLLTSGGKPVQMLYLFDSNGCRVIDNPGEGMNPDNVDKDKVFQGWGVQYDQVRWFKRSVQKSVKKYGELPILSFMHIPPISNEQVTAIYPDANTFPFKPDKEGDFGTSTEKIVGAYDADFWYELIMAGCTDIYSGHQHQVATSIVIDGIRVTYGLKTGTYAYHDEELCGSTKIVVSAKDKKATTSYVPTNIPYAVNKI